MTRDQIIAVQATTFLGSKVNVTIGKAGKREERYQDAIKAVPESTLGWFLDMLNRYRGPEDRKESLLEIFDPSMFTENHRAWELSFINLSQLTCSFMNSFMLNNTDNSV